MKYAFPLIPIMGSLILMGCKGAQVTETATISPTHDHCRSSR